MSSNTSAQPAHTPSAEEGDQPAPPEPVAPTAALTVVLTRHAERIAVGADPGLSAAGQDRARLLARMLQDAPVRGVYVTEVRRSRETGEPIANAAGVPLTQYSALDAVSLAATITAEHPTGTLLVIAHSNTVGPIAAALGADGVGDLTENEFDRMFILSRHSDETSLLRLRFGANAH